MQNNNSLETYGEDASCQEGAKRKPSAEDDLPRLGLRHVLGFNGKIVNGLVVHPLGKHVIYAVGRQVIIEEIVGPCKGKQHMLVGHLEPVSSLAVSGDGQFIVSGQMNAIRESRSPVLLWDWCSRRKIMDRKLHKETTIALVFTCSSRYFVSLGGPDDGELALWDTTEKCPQALKCAQVGRVGASTVIKASHVDQSMFVSFGACYGRIWKFDRDTNKLTYSELLFGSSARKIICAEIADKDNSYPPRIFCGTSSGTVIVFNGDSGVLITEIFSPSFPMGVTALTYTRMLNDNTYCMLVGTGEGRVNYYTFHFEKKGNKCSAKMALYSDSHVWQDPQCSSVTSISKIGVGQQFYVGVHQSQMYRFSLVPWNAQLLRTCSNTTINQVAFARGTDELLVTAEPEKVRVFNLKVMLEVRRFVRSGRDCKSLCVRHDGTHIMTGWDCGDILVLGFEPKGLGLQILYRIDNAHRQAVSCMALTAASEKLVTGGEDFFVSVWRLVDDLDLRGRRLRQGLRVFHFVDQKGPITCLRIAADDKRCVCSSLDGTAAVYDLITGLRLQLFSWTCGLSCVALCQTDLQAVTSSSDGRLQWWDMVSGHWLRELQGSSSGGVCSIDTEPTCRQLVATGGDDRLIKIWRIDEGTVCHVGEGHSDTITMVKFGPCGSVLLSAAKDGSVCIWDVPQEKM
ncbi:WD repeat-containing protein 16 [Elysia marginata]|uniref:Cilia- and flagella-associated protein 52 n=1 Tax=Elysia marginata TaxID=1093978 RepID=A0AAV4H170_9GAST|nr:WD repeat-containing protein 16 [Elysia marginata]